MTGLLVCFSLTGERQIQSVGSGGPSRTYIFRPQNVAGSQSAWSISTSYSCWVNTSGGPRVGAA